MKSKESSNTKETLTTKQAGTGESKGQAHTKLVSTGIVPDERSQTIAEAAYYRAERRGFDPQGQVEDWLAAESEVNTLISKSKQAS